MVKAIFVLPTPIVMVEVIIAESVDVKGSVDTSVVAGQLKSCRWGLISTGSEFPQQTLLSFLEHTVSFKKVTVMAFDWQQEIRSQIYIDNSLLGLGAGFHKYRNMSNIKELSFFGIFFRSDKNSNSEEFNIVFVERLLKPLHQCKMPYWVPSQCHNINN